MSLESVARHFSELGKKLAALKPKFDQQQNVHNPYDRVTFEPVISQDPDGMVNIRGHRVPPFAKVKLSVGEMVYVAWRGSQPIGILKFGWQKAHFAPVMISVGKSVIEELFYESSADEIFFRNDDAIVNLRIKDHITVTSFGSIGWGMGRDRFFVQTGAQIFAIFRIDRNPNKVLGTQARNLASKISLEHVENLATNTTTIDSWSNTDDNGTVVITATVASPGSTARRRSILLDDRGHLIGYYGTGASRGGSTDAPIHNIVFMGQREAVWVDITAGTILYNTRLHPEDFPGMDATVDFNTINFSHVPYNFSSNFTTIALPYRDAMILRMKTGSSGVPDIQLAFAAGVARIFSGQLQGVETYTPQPMSVVMRMRKPVSALLDNLTYIDSGSFSGSPQTLGLDWGVIGGSLNRVLWYRASEASGGAPTTAMGFLDFPAEGIPVDVAFAMPSRLKLTTIAGSNVVTSDVAITDATIIDLVQRNFIMFGKDLIYLPDLKFIGSSYSVPNTKTKIFVTPTAAGIKAIKKEEVLDKMDGLKNIPTELGYDPLFFGQFSYQLIPDSDALANLVSRAI